MASYYELSKSVRITNSEPVDGDRYIAENIAQRNALLVAGNSVVRAHEGLQVYVKDSLNDGNPPIPKLYILVNLNEGTWEEIAIGTGIPEAPNDGTIYGRGGDPQNWVGVLPLTGGNLSGKLTMLPSNDIFFYGGDSGPTRYPSMGIHHDGVTGISSIYTVDHAAGPGGQTDAIQIKINDYIALKLATIVDGLVTSNVEVSEITDDKHLVTKEYVDLKYAKKASSSTIDKTYAELKAMQAAGEFVPGQAYKIIDFRSLWYINDDTDSNVSDWGLWVGIPEVVSKYGLTLNIEPLVVIAESANKLKENATSPSNPKHIIKYDPRWAGQESVDTTFPTSAATTEFRGTITYRHDPYLDVSASFDWRAVQSIRWKVTADEYDNTQIYARYAAVKVTDSEGDGHYISLRDGNENHTPGSSSDWWLEFRAPGADTSGMYKDYWAYSNKANTLLSGSQVGPSNVHQDAWEGALSVFKPIVDDFKVFYTFAISTDLTNSAGFTSNWSAWFYQAHVKEQFHNVIMIKSGEGRNIELGKSAERNTIISKYFNSFKAVSNRFKNNYIYGYVGASDLKGLVTGNHIDGMFTVSIPSFLQASIMKLTGGADNTACLQHVTISGSEILYKRAASIQYATLLNIDKLSAIGDLSNINIEAIKNTTVLGSITGSRFSYWDGVLIPVNITINNTVFYVPKLTENFTFGTSLVTYSGITVNRLYDDGTVEKLWYVEITDEGLEIIKEFK